jgi:hypothetical protein
LHTLYGALALLSNLVKYLKLGFKLCFKKSKEIEDTNRIASFLKITSEIDWESKSPDGWKLVFDKCTDLVKGEIDYYYKSRKRSRRVSFWFRFFGLIFGTAGLLAPLLETTGLGCLKGAAPFGYLFLAISASFFAANSLFGGTSGHTRYVVTQLNLEKTLTLMVVQWSKLVSKNSTDEVKADFIHEKMNDVYSIIMEETDVWGKALAQAVDTYEKKVSQKPNGKS